jgi:hypothetical protein
MSERPKVSQIVINEFSKIIDSQDVKGISKYHKSIDNASDADYNWELMALEEAADLQKYLVKQIIKLKAENHILKCKSWFKVNQENLALAQENASLKEQLDTVTQAYEAFKKAR